MIVILVTEHNLLLYNHNFIYNNHYNCTLYIIYLLASCLLVTYLFINDSNISYWAYWFFIK